jgi:serine protease Do
LPEEPLIEEGTTLVPMRPIFEALGAKVTWHNLYNEVEAEKDGVNIKLPIGKKIAIKNGYMEELQVATKIVNGTTFVPLRFVGEALRAQVEWDEEAEIITINTSVNRLNMGSSSPSHVLSVDIAKQAKYVVMVMIFDKDENLTATASGVAVGPGGLVATNYHVIEGAASVLIINDREESFEVEGVLAFDEERDLAIIKVNGDLPYTSLGNSEDIVIGEQVFSIGSPLGIKNTVSSGMVSNLIEIENQPFIQTTAPISLGSSGGALFNAQGQLIGITTATIAKGQGLNLAIPINDLKKLTNKLAQEPLPLEEMFPEDYLLDGLILDKDKLLSHLTEHYSEFNDGSKYLRFSYLPGKRVLYDYEIDVFIDPTDYGTWLGIDQRERLAIVGRILQEIDAKVDLAQSFRVLFIYQEYWPFYPSVFEEDEISPSEDGKGWLVTHIIAKGFTTNDEITWEVYH